MNRYTLPQSETANDQNMQAVLPPLQSYNVTQGGYHREIPVVTVVAEALPTMPQELRVLHQWAVAAPDKRPLTVHGRPASSTDPATWCDLESAYAAAIALGDDYGVGFMLHEDDPYTIVDFDVVTAKTQEAKGLPVDPSKWTTHDEYDVIWRICQSLDSYTEQSRSGEGLHAIVKAKLLRKGVKRGRYEIYDRQRFIICTGKPVINRPIIARQEHIDSLVTWLVGSVEETTIQLEEVAPTMTDDEVWQKALNAENNEKFVMLCKGAWKEMGYPSQSEADLALLSIFCFYTKSNDQVRRMFRQTGLGQRPKAVVNDVYINRTLRLARSNEQGDSVDPYMDWQGLCTINHAKVEAKKLSEITPPENDESGAALLNRLCVKWVTDEYVEVPDIVQGLVADEEITLLGGHGGVGKSFLALQIACAVAIGSEVLFRDTRHNRVLYYSAEDGRKRLTRRLRDIAEDNGYDVDRLSSNLKVIDASELEPLYGLSDTSQGDKSFRTVLGPKADFKNLQKMVESFDPQLVVIDGASDTFDGNEIARREVRAFVKLLRRLHPRRSIGVLLLVHIDRSSARGNRTNDDGYTGSSQWHNSCRRRLFLQMEVEKDDDTHTVLREDYFLRIMKNQDGPSEPDTQLVRSNNGFWNVVDANFGCSELQNEDAINEKILRLIREYYCRDQYMSVSLAPQASTGVYPTLKNDPKFPKRMKRKQLDEIVRQLEREGRLRREEFKRSNRSVGERWAVA